MHIRFLRRFNDYETSMINIKITGWPKTTFIDHKNIPFKVLKLVCIFCPYLFNISIIDQQKNMCVRKDRNEDHNKFRKVKKMKSNCLSPDTLVYSDILMSMDLDKLKAVSF